MQEIVKNRPDVFGPIGGRTTDLTKWLGSQDPDAQRFLTAQTVAAEHMAGAFGGVAAATINAIKEATGKFKDNPEALAAALDQVLHSVDVLEQKGQVNYAGKAGGGWKVIR